MDNEEKLFNKWMNLQQDIQTIATLLQNPLDQSGITSIDLAEWKTRCMNFEDKYFRLKQSIENLITEYLT